MRAMVIGNEEQLSSEVDSYSDRYLLFIHYPLFNESNCQVILHSFCLFYQGHVLCLRSLLEFTFLAQERTTSQRIVVQEGELGQAHRSLFLPHLFLLSLPLLVPLPSSSSPTLPFSSIHRQEQRIPFDPPWTTTINTKPTASGQIQQWHPQCRPSSSWISRERS